MEKRKGLSHDAYGGIKGEDYVPYIPSNAILPEFTVTSIIMGMILAVVFGATNAYLGLKVGMTVSASIPAAVVATALLKGILKKDSILEANIVQSTASAGESIASGIMFTLPALLLWGFDLTISKIVTVAVLGTIIGVLFVVPLRRYLTVEEHGNLPYPEGMATAEVLVAGDVGGSGAGVVAVGGIVGGIYKLLSGGLAAWKEEIEWAIPGIKNGIFGFDILASLLGVGFIVGVEISSAMLAGGLLAWLVLIPLISYFGADVPHAIFPSSIPISQMDAWSIWSKYIRYIGAGGVAAGGFISLIKSAPTIYNSFKAALGGLLHGSKGEIQRTNKDLSIITVFIGVLAVFISAVVFPNMKVSILGSLAIILFGFFFAAVSARIVGLVGVSNNPVSGMTIASLLASTAILRFTGIIGNTGMIAAITVGGTICVAISIAGTAAQNLKTTHIIGGTPKYVQLGVLIGGIACSAFVGWVILMLHQAYGMGSDKLPAPQATLMSMVVKGVMTGTLPWALVIAGIFFGIILAILKLPVLPIALGLYLPLHLSTGILIGGIIRSIVDKVYKGEELKEKVEKGVLLSSGLIAGDALIGIVIAIIAYLNYSDKFAVFSKLPLSGNPWFGFVMYLLLAAFLYFYIKTNKEKA